MQCENFGNTRRDLNISNQNLTNLTHNIADFWQFLVPFNNPPSPPNSPSHSWSSERSIFASSSDSSELPNLLDNYNGKLRENTIEEYTSPLPRLTYTPTVFGEAPLYYFSRFRSTVNPPWLSRQAVHREQLHRPFVTVEDNRYSHQNLTPPPISNTPPTPQGQLNGWGEDPCVRSIRWRSEANATSTWDNSIIKNKCLNN